MPLSTDIVVVCIYHNFVRLSAIGDPRFTWRQQQILSLKIELFWQYCRENHRKSQMYSEQEEPSNGKYCCQT